MKAVRSDLSIYIGSVEVYYLAFPRYDRPYQLSAFCQERLAAALKIATEVAERFTQDGRDSATPQELIKAFNRSF